MNPNQKQQVCSRQTSLFSPASGFETHFVNSSPSVCPSLSQVHFNVYIISDSNQYSRFQHQANFDVEAYRAFVETLRLSHQVRGSSSLLSSRMSILGQACTEPKRLFQVRAAAYSIWYSGIGWVLNTTASLV